MDRAQGQLQGCSAAYEITTQNLPQLLLHFLFEPPHTHKSKLLPDDTTKREEENQEEINHSHLDDWPYANLYGNRWKNKMDVDNDHPTNQCAVFCSNYHEKKIVYEKC